jgi:hypothetical protein
VDVAESARDATDDARRVTQSGSESAFRKLLANFGGNTHGQRPVRDVRCHDGASADDTAGADGEVFEHHGTGAKVRAPTNAYIARDMAPW